MSKIKKILTRISIILLLGLMITGGCYHYARSDIPFIDFRNSLSTLMDGTTDLAFGADHSATDWKGQYMNSDYISPVFKWMVSGYTKTEFSGITGDYKGPYYLGLAYDGVTYYDASGTPHALAYTDFGDVTVKINEGATDIASSKIGDTGISSGSLTVGGRTLSLSSQELGYTGGGYNNRWKLIYNFDTKYYTQDGYSCVWEPQNNTTLAGSAYRVKETFTLYLNKKTVNKVTTKEEHNYSITGADEGGAAGYAGSINMNLLKRNGEEFVLKYEKLTGTIDYDPNKSTSHSNSWQSAPSCHTEKQIDGIPTRSYGITWHNNGGTVSGDQAASYTYGFKGWSFNNSQRNDVGFKDDQLSEFDNSADGYRILKPVATIYLLKPVQLSLTARWKRPKIDMPTASKTGYTFNGWYLNEKYEGTSYSGDDTYSTEVTSPINFYAKYTPIQYNVKIEGNLDEKSTASKANIPNGVFRTDGVDEGICFGSCFYDVTYRIDNPTLPGYTFKGWSFTNSAGQTVIKSPVDGQSYLTFENLRDTQGAEVTLTAQWTPKTYTIYYKHNDADDVGTGNAPYPKMSSTVSKNELIQKITFDSEVNELGDTFKLLKADNFSLKGYTFDTSKGWNTKQNGDTSTRYEPGSKFTLNASNMSLADSNDTITLWARWTPITYKIKFDGNKPKTASTELKGEPKGVKKFSNTNSDEVYTELVYDVEYVPETIISLYGYNFLDWNKKEDGSEPYESAVAGTPSAIPVIKNLTDKAGATVTLYAQWKPITYKIKFDGNKPSTSSSTIENLPTGVVNCKTGGAVTSEMTFDQKYEPDKTVSMVGYNFQEWNTKADGSGTSYKGEGTSLAKPILSNLTGKDGETITLYAQWKPITYKIKFNGNKGNASTELKGEPKGVKKFSDTNSTEVYTELTYDVKYVPESIVSLFGYKFLNWNRKQDGSVPYESVVEGMPLTLPVIENLTTVDGATVTLYGQWKPITYKIKFDGNKPSTSSSTIENLPTGVVNCNDESGTVTSEMTFDQKYKPNKTVSMVGYNFQEWNTKADGSGTSYKGDPTYALPILSNLTGTDGKTITLYAQWKPITYKIKFDGNKGSASTDLVNVPEGVVNVKGSNPPLVTEMVYDQTYRPEKMIELFGYDFQNWNTKQDGSGKSYVGEADTILPMPKLTNLTTVDGATVTLYAQWKAKEFSIKFCHNDAEYTAEGGTKTVNDAVTPMFKDNPDAELTLLLKFDQPVTLNDADVYTLQGWTFDESKGWNTKADGSGKHYAPGTKFTLNKDKKDLVTGSNGAITGGFNLYAQWEANTYIIVYDSNTPTAITHSHYASNEPKRVSDNCQYYVYESDYDNAEGSKTTLVDCPYTLHGWTWNCYGLANDSLKQQNKGNDVVTLNTMSILKNVVDDYFGDDTILSLYCQWEPNDYFVLYDANGGEAEDGATIVDQECLYDKDYSMDENVYTRVDAKYNNVLKSTHYPLNDSYKSYYTTYDTVCNTTYDSKFEYNFMGWSFNKAATKASEVHYKDKAQFTNMTDAYDAYKGVDISTDCNTSDHKADRKKQAVNLYAVWNAKPNITVESSEVCFDYYEGADINSNQLKLHVVAHDKEDGGLTNKIVLSKILYYNGDIDKNPTKLDTSSEHIGAMTLFFTVTDSDGNTREVSFEGNIFYNQPPKVVKNEVRYMYLQTLKKLINGDRASNTHKLEEALALGLEFSDKEDDIYNSLSVADRNLLKNERYWGGITPVLRFTDIESARIQLSSMAGAVYGEAKKVLVPVQYFDRYRKPDNAEGDTTYITVYVIDQDTDFDDPDNYLEEDDEVNAKTYPNYVTKKYVRFLSNDVIDEDNPDNPYRLEELSYWRLVERKRKFLTTMMGKTTPEHTVSYTHEEVVEYKKDPKFYNTGYYVHKDIILDSESITWAVSSLSGAVEIPQIFL